MERDATTTAARAEYNWDRGLSPANPAWDHTSEDLRKQYRDRARAGLDAVRPLIVGEAYERVEAEWHKGHRKFSIGVVREAMFRGEDVRQPREEP